MTSNKGKIGVIGSGLIGSSWAMLFASGGYTVSLYDVDSGQVDRALAKIGQELKSLEERGFLKGSLSAEEQHKLISRAENLEILLKDAFYIQENVPEKLEIKQSVFNEIDKLCDDKVILASSSSAMPASTIGSHLKHRSQLIIIHPFNPPYHVRAVEVTPAPFTDPEVIRQSKCLLESIGQVPIMLLKELPGFVGPRVQAVMIEEGMRLVKDGIMSAEDFDKMMTEGLAYRWAFVGPLETCHLNADGFRDYCARYGASMYASAASCGPALPFEGEHVQAINDYLYSSVSLDQLAARRQWRDERIASLAALKKKLQ